MRPLLFCFAALCAGLGASLLRAAEVPAPLSGSAGSPEAVSPAAGAASGPEAPPPSQPSFYPNTLAFGTMDNGWGLSYERFLDPRFSMQLRADMGNTQWVGGYGLGGSARFYPIGAGGAAFYGALRLRLFEQVAWGNGPGGFYRGLRGGPQAGIRLPLRGAWVLTYDLAWSWDVSLYQSDPDRLIGDAWMADQQYSGSAAGRISDAVGLGWTF